MQTDNNPNRTEIVSFYENGDSDSGDDSVDSDSDLGIDYNHTDDRGGSNSGGSMSGSAPMKSVYSGYED
jgi:hypothetical protein